jgi:ethanolamine utilization protein EutN
MLLAQVCGTVVATQKEPKLEGHKFLVVVPVHPQTLALDGKPLVAVDAIGAGMKEMVLVVTGSSARQTLRTKETPVDAVIVGIIDEVEFQGKRTYEKYSLTSIKP